MEKYQGLDFMLTESRLSPEERMVLETVRAFVQDQAMPIIRDHYEEGTFPAELIEPMAELGIFGATIEGYGCAGVNHVSYGLMMQELERGDSGLRSFASVHSSLAMYAIHEFGSEEQRSRWLPEMAAGKVIGCFGLTEPDYGSNPAGMMTTAVEDGGEYVLNGAKMWITNGTTGHLAIVWAKLDGVVRGFLVEGDRPGLEGREMKHKLSMRASDTAELILSDCRIPKANLLRGTTGMKSALMCLTQARHGIAWGVVGAAMACFDEALQYSKDRIQFGKPIASFQLTQKKLADMATEISLSQLLCLQLGRLMDEGAAEYEQVSLAKRNNVRKALEIARSARTILGANGISGEYQCMRHMVNLETVDTYEGTYEIHSLILGSRLTGIDAYE